MRCSTPVSCSSVSGSNVVMMQRCRRSCTPMTTSPILNRAPSQVRSSSPETPPITTLGRRRRPSAPRARIAPSVATSSGSTSNRSRPLASTRLAPTPTATTTSDSTAGARHGRPSTWGSPTIPRVARWPSNRGRVVAVTMRPWEPSTYATRSPTIPSGRTSARPSGSPAMDLTGKRHSSATCIVSSGYLQLLRVPPLRLECRIEPGVGDRVDVVGERLRCDVSHDLQDLRFCVPGREECRRLSLLNEPLVADDCTGESHEGIDLRIRNGPTGADGIDDFGARLQYPGDRRMRSHAIGAGVFGAHRDLDQLPLDPRERALVEPGVEPEGALEQGRRFRKGGVQIGDEAEGLVYLLEQGLRRFGGVGAGVLRERCHGAVSSGREWLTERVTSETIYYR